jgi:hypothetical protein
MINVYAKIDGKLAHWEVSYHDYLEAIKIVKASLPAEYTGTVLARIK